MCSIGILFIDIFGGIVRWDEARDLPREYKVQRRDSDSGEE